tara:strand:+ start:2029 stop:2148 length:120 start_codon:yes stop_codon:yes gene_type:complete
MENGLVRFAFEIGIGITVPAIRAFLSVGSAFGGLGHAAD